MIDWKIFSTVFGTIFLAEIGDKTQLVTMNFAASHSEAFWSVFLGSAMALIVTSSLGVFFGGAVSRVIPMKLIHSIAGIAFIIIGVFMITSRN